MSLNELFLSGAKPKSITRYTSAVPTGTYVPTEDMARCFVRVQAGGGGGYSGISTAGGGGGAMAEVMIRVPIAGLPYVVGAGGAINTNGSLSSFGPYAAMGGFYGQPLGCGQGGTLGNASGSVDTDSVQVFASSPLPGVAGGSSGYTSAAGQRAGWPIGVNAPYATGPFMSNSQFGNGQGNASGGDSFYGTGGTNGNSPAATAYGAGAGANAVGAAGCIEIWDFGA